MTSRSTCRPRFKFEPTSKTSQEHAIGSPDAATSRKITSRLAAMASGLASSCSASTWQGYCERLTPWRCVRACDGRSNPNPARPGVRGQGVITAVSIRLTRSIRRAAETARRDVRGRSLHVKYTRRDRPGRDFQSTNRYPEKAAAPWRRVCLHQHPAFIVSVSCCGTRTISPSAFPPSTLCSALLLHHYFIIPYVI